MLRQLFTPLLLAFLLITNLCHSLTTNAQSVAWQKNMGGTQDDIATHIEPTADGGYIFIATVSSNDMDVVGGLQAHHGGKDIWVVKTNSANAVQWKRCLGGTADDVAASILLANGGGYLITGATNSTNGDVSGNHGNSDLWVVKLSDLGAIDWQRCYGGAGNETTSGYSSATATIDNNIAMIGDTDMPNSGDIGNGNGGAWAIKINASNGNIIWGKLIGGSWGDDGFAIAQAPDGSFVAVGRGSSPDIPTANPPTAYGQTDIIVSKINSTGTTVDWAKMLGGSDAYDGGHGVSVAPDGTIYVVGNVMSTDGNCTDKHGVVWESDAFAAALSPTGTILWTNCIGGNGNFDVFIGATTDATGNLIATGWVNGGGGDVSNFIGYEDAWLVAIDKTTGAVMTEKTYGGTGQDRFYHARRSAANYYIAGFSSSSDGDLTGNNGLLDAWLLTVGCSLTVNITGNNTPCANTNATYSVAAGPTGATYIWSINGGTVASGCGNTDNTCTVNWGNAGAGSVSVTQSNP